MYFQTLCLILAIPITLSGVWIHWRKHDFHMDAEEAQKNGKLTHAQVERRMLLIKRGGRVLTITGMVLLVASLVAAVD